jgi:hypothetical protein
MRKIICLILIQAFAYSALGQLSPLSVGTIHPGDSIVIKYDVIINNPLVPPNTTQISNQGTCSGSNFSNVLTDDPDTGPANDPTITLLNQFALPVTLTEFKASQAGNTVILNWKVETEYNLEKYVIERSNDGRTFTAIGEVPGKNIPGTLYYTFTDLQPYADNNYYRLRAVDIDGEKKYSAIVLVKLGGLIPTITIFPNPVINKSLTLQMQNMKAGLYHLRLYNSTGQAVLSKQLNHTGGSASQALYLPVTLPAGYYQMEILHAESRSSFKLVIQ